MNNNLVVSSSVVKNSILKAPLDVTSIETTFVPIIRDCQKINVSTLQKGDTQNAQTFNISLNSVEGDSINLLYLFVTLPKQYSFETNEFLRYQDYYGLKCFNYINLFIDEIMYEQLTPDILYLKIIDYYKNNIDNVYQSFIGESNNVLYYSTSKNQLLVDEKKICLPLLFSFFMNKDKLKTNLLSDKKIKIVIHYSKIEDIFCYSQNKKLFNQIDFTNTSIVIENLLLDTGSNVYKSTEYLSEEAQSVPYYFIDNYYEISTSRSLKHNDLKLNFRQGNVNSFDIYLKIDYFNKKELFYGYNVQGCVLNYLNSLIHFDSKRFIANNKLILNLKNGLFIGKNSNEEEDIVVTKLDSTKYRIVYKTIDKEILTTFIKSSIAWDNLSDNVYFDIGMNIKNLKNYNRISIFFFKTLIFKFQQNENNLLLVDNEKIVLGLCKLNGNYILGFTNYEKSDLFSEELIFYLASKPVDKDYNSNKYVNGNYFYISDVLNNCYDLNKKYKIQIDYLQFNNKKIIDNDMLKIMNTNFKNDKQTIISNLKLDYDIFYTNATKAINSNDMLEVFLSNKLFKYNNNVINDLHVYDFFNLYFYQKHNRFFYYLNNNLHLYNETLSKLENVVKKNFSLPMKRNDRSLLKNNQKKAKLY